jgi:hypothetical protein
MALSKKRQTNLFKKSNVNNGKVENYPKGESSTRTQKKRQNLKKNS